MKNKILFSLIIFSVCLGIITLIFMQCKEIEVIDEDPCVQLENAQTQADMNILSNECYIKKHSEYTNFISSLDYSKMNSKEQQAIKELIETYDKRTNELIEKEFPHRDEHMYYGSSFSMQYSFLLINFDEAELKKIKQILNKN